MLTDLLTIDKEDSKPVYLQIADRIANLLTEGIVTAGSKLPSSRFLANHLQVHRQTCVAAYEELTALGWIESIAGKGTFVASQLPSPKPDIWKTALNESSKKVVSIPKLLDRPLRLTTESFHLDDGLPDARLAPREELAREIKKQLTGSDLYYKLQYADTRGNAFLRQVLRDYLQESRGMNNLTADQIIITRGVTQALFMFINCFLKADEFVAVTQLSWESANVNFRYHGLRVQYIRYDEFGIDIDHLAEVCNQYKISCVYLTPHHHYPTTVIMPAHRRVQMLDLAKKYGFYIFEDDYDYDFHYISQPIMPLASSLHAEHVFYTGSFTKALAPTFRVGYLVASAAQVDLLAKYRRLVDRQGDNLLELAIANLLKDGTIQKYLRRNRKIYLSRRNYFCDLLKEHLSEYLRFTIPDGGMSVWVKFDKKLDFKQFVSKCADEDLYIQDCASLEDGPINEVRLGFASSNENELEISVSKMKGVLQAMANK